MVPSGDLYAEPGTYTFMGYMLLFEQLGLDYTLSTYASEGGNFGFFTANDMAKRLNAKAAKTTLTPAEQACLTMATVGRGEPATWDGIQAAIDWVEANSFHSKFPEPKVC